MTREAHTDSRAMQNPQSFWKQHGKTCRVYLGLAAEAFTEATAICYTEIQQSVKGILSAVLLKMATH